MQVGELIVSALAENDRADSATAAAVLMRVQESFMRWLQSSQVRWLEPFAPDKGVR